MKKLQLIILVFILISTSTNTNADSSRFITNDHLVVDLKNGIEWLRCSVGQQWDGQTCVGNIVNLSLDLVPQALDIANQQLGGKWRLPSKSELTSIICKTCSSPKIN